MAGWILLNHQTLCWCAGVLGKWLSLEYFYSSNQGCLKAFIHLWGCYCLNGTSPSQGDSLWEVKWREEGEDISVPSIKWHNAKHEVSAWEQQPMWQPAVWCSESLGLFILWAMLPTSSLTSLTVTSGSTCTHNSLWKSVSATGERGFSYCCALRIACSCACLEGMHGFHVGWLRNISFPKFITFLFIHTLAYNWEAFSSNSSGNTQ